MGEGSQSIVESFRANLGSVKRLSNFDEIVIEIATSSITKRDQALADALRPRGVNIPERLSGARIVTQLENLRENQSLRQEYSVMFNQCIVLQVSYFASSLHDLFRYFFQRRIEEGGTSEILKEELKVSFGQLNDLGWDVKANAADLFLSARDLSFQDMQSVTRSFSKWLGFSRPRDSATNTIIVGQAARHCIVHTGGRVSSRMLSQIRDCTDAEIFPNLREGALIISQPCDIALLSKAMDLYMTELSEGLSMCPAPVEANPGSRK